MGAEEVDDEAIFDGRDGDFSECEECGLPKQS